MAETPITARARRWLLVFAGGWAASAALGSLLGVAHGLNAEYFANAQHLGMPDLRRVDADISTAQMTSAWRGRPPEAFSVRWYGYLMVRQPGEYVVGTRSDDASFQIGRAHV